MRTARLKKAKKGWFIGDYPDAAFRAIAFEAALKIEKAGERVARHLHRIATEITLVVQGRVRFNHRKFKKGDIIILPPGEAADYEVLKDAITVIVKVPCVKNDKYYVEKSK
jgi:quercetin dioxygenase-like cupin family protein